MSTSIQAPSRSLLRVLRANLEGPTCKCTRSKRRLLPVSQQRWQTTDAAQQDEFVPQNTPKSDVSRDGRWSQTPPAMKAPVRARPQRQAAFKVNGDPEVLDGMYSRFLGRNGPKMLSTETKWLAVTHKSFDHGRRGFNDRLSFLGRQIIELQATLAVLNSASSSGTTHQQNNPYYHPATANVEVLNGERKAAYMHPLQMSSVAAAYGLPEVVRWQPKDVDNLGASGCNMVYAQALFAIIGALSLEQGNLLTNRIVRERILERIGLGSNGLSSAPGEPLLNAASA